MTVGTRPHNYSSQASSARMVSFAADNRTQRLCGKQRIDFMVLDGFHGTDRRNHERVEPAGKQHPRKGEGEDELRRRFEVGRRGR